MSVLSVLFSGFIILSAQTSGNNVVDVILKGYSAKVFTTNPVSDNEIDLIVKCGMKAPSGMNRQPWKFTVVKDQTVTVEILKNITAGNILIIVSGQKRQDGTVDNFAQGLSLGVHIYAGPVGNINTNLKQKLGIPDDYEAVTVLRVGSIDNSVDAVSGASARKKPEEVVNYK
jgi:hypothetical protein